VARARGARPSLDPAPGAAVADQGRRGRRARCCRSEWGQRGVDGRAARAVRRPDPGAPRAAHPEPRVVAPEAVRTRPARSPAGERQPPARRPVRRRARTRPELPLAAVRQQPGPRDGRRAALAGRRRHLAGPRPRRRLGNDRRPQAPRAAAHPARGRAGAGIRGAPRTVLIRNPRGDTIRRRVARMPEQPLFSISQVSTLAASFADDLRAYAAAGVDGVGVWELKLGEGSLEEFRASGLGAATAVPSVPSIHPLPLLPGPDTVRERVDALLRSLEALAAYAPAAI